MENQVILDHLNYLLLDLLMMEQEIHIGFMIASFIFFMLFQKMQGKQVGFTKSKEKGKFWKNLKKV